MRRLLAFLALTLAFAAASFLGWWAVPATAALWGALRPSLGRPALVAALAAALAWSGWLLVDTISGDGAFGVLAGRLSALMELPPFALVVLTLAFAALLAWSTTVVAGAIFPALLRPAGGRSTRRWRLSMTRMVSVMAALGIGAGAFPLAAQTNWDSVSIRTIPAGRGVHMLVGSGGNIALAVGEDFAFLVDDQFAPLSAKILAAIRAVTDKPVRFLVNTHWHGDHAGGNENMTKAGVIIVAHDNVRTRMSTDQFIVALNSPSPASPKGALPVVTFAESVAFHLGNETIHAVHVPPAHTDGDAIVHFTRANTIHMGDIFFNGRYPFVDLSSGGSFEGVIRAVEVGLTYTNDSTKVIPGHGALATQADLVNYRNVLAAVRDRVAALIRQGKTKEQVIAAKPTAEWDATWGTGFMKPDVFLGIVYESMKKK